MKIKKIIKNIVYFLLNYFLFFRSYSNKAAILMYHSVDINSLFFTVRLEEFAKQMAYLKNEKFNVISLSKLVEWIEKKQIIPKKTVVLTFDDGYEDNCSNVLPILKRYNFPATIFLVSGLIGQKAGDSQKIVLNMLTWMQIKEMYQSGLIDFQPHSLTHKKLNRIDSVSAEQEIKGSKITIEEQLNKKCYLFSYPRGGFDERIINILKKFKFRAGLSINKGFVSNNSNLFKLSRQSINSKTSFEEFKVKLKFNF